MAGGLNVLSRHDRGSGASPTRLGGSRARSPASARTDIENSRYLNCRETGSSWRMAVSLIMNQSLTRREGEGGVDQSRQCKWPTGSA